MQDMRTEKINKYIKGTPESVFNPISANDNYRIADREYKINAALTIF